MPGQVSSLEMKVHLPYSQHYIPQGMHHLSASQLGHHFGLYYIFYQDFFFSITLLLCFTDIDVLNPGPVGLSLNTKIISLFFLHM